MPLLELFHSNRKAVLSMDIEAIAGIAGKKLADGSEASSEFRQFLNEVGAEELEKYANHCLQNKFDENGHVLQDVVNEIGRRLDYSVENGRYRGVANDIGFDGIWSDERTKTKLVVEVKTTDAYTIKLETIATYRDKLAKLGKVNNDSPILLVIGRDETQSLEAQVRGSKHAWSMRIIGIEALVKLMNIKLDSSTTEVTDKIHSILAPIEYTRVDTLVDIVFTATTDKKIELEGVEPSDQEMRENSNEKHYQTPQVTSSEIQESIRSSLIDAFGKKFGKFLIKKKNSLYADQTGEYKVAVIVSKHYEKKSKDYWYGYHDSQRTFLSSATYGFMIFGMVDSEIGLVVPFSDMEKYRERMDATQRGTGEYRHVEIVKKSDSYFLKLRGDDLIALDNYKINVPT